jgi:hypothetical protein
MSFKALTKAVKKSRKDEFEIGTVIRFTSGGRYTYAVIKTAIGWISTARWDNGFVNKDLTFEELLEILGRSNVTDVMVSLVWLDLESGEAFADDNEGAEKFVEFTS